MTEIFDWARSDLTGLLDWARSDLTGLFDWAAFRRDSGHNDIGHHCVNRDIHHHRLLVVLVLALALTPILTLALALVLALVLCPLAYDHNIDE